MAERQTSLRALIRAPHLEQVARILPYHARIASPRAPGALRLGGKEASTHLGIPILDSRAQRQATVGIEHCRTALLHLINAKHPLLMGSGAPGTGLAPGLAWHDEIATFKTIGWS